MQDQSEANAIAVIAEEGPGAGYWVIVRAVAQPETMPPSSTLWKIERSLDSADLTWGVVYVGDGPLKSPTNILPIPPALLKAAGKAIYHAFVWVAHHGGSKALEETLPDIVEEAVKTKKSGRERRKLLEAAKCARSFIAPKWDVDADSTGLLCTEMKSEKDTFYFMLRYGNPCALIMVKRDGETYTVQSCEEGELKKPPKGSG
jgi:hypothetical protein